MSKKKTNEINDIIDSSYAEADYSYSNDYYDEVDSHRHRHRNNTYSNSDYNPFTKISITRESTASASASASASFSNTNTFNASNTSNIFMKYTNSDKPVVTTTHTPKEIKNIEDDFPSLGGGKKPNAPIIPPAMNFKKIVETKKPVETQQQIVNTKIKPKNDEYYNRLKAYEEVKYYSEKNARSKIYSRAYSDEDEDEDGDDDDYE